MQCTEYWCRAAKGPPCDGELPCLSRTRDPAVAIGGSYMGVRRPMATVSALLYPCTRKVAVGGGDQRKHSPQSLADVESILRVGTELE